MSIPWRYISSEFHTNINIENAGMTRSFLPVANDYKYSE